MSVELRVSASPFAERATPYVSVLPNAVVRVTVAGESVPPRANVCELPSARISLVKKPSASYS